MSLSEEEAADLAVDCLSELSESQIEAHQAINRILIGPDGDPFIDIHSVFSYFDALYFRGLLFPRVEVSWSTRLTLCAGMCELLKDEQGKYRRIRLKLSEPLLKYRPRSDTLNTLLHEAIHAYFFITSSWRHSRKDDPSGHGTGFQRLASAINHHGSYDITIYHTFYDEVESYRKHVWKCDGPCQHEGPYFGVVKRSMNRAPGKGDHWWKKHEEGCGGIFRKISEPEITNDQLRRLSNSERAGRQKNKIDKWVTQSASETTTIDTALMSLKALSDKAERRTLKRKEHNQHDSPQHQRKTPLLTCPICDTCVPDKEINHHLDVSHPVDERVT